MSKKRGLSIEEKRTKLLELFYEKKEFFQLKELEKIAPKEKGIISQSVKEVLQSLVDDGLVEADKIGTSIYYWAFPSKLISEKTKKLEAILTNLNDSKDKLSKLCAQLENKKKENEDMQEKQEIMQKLTELQSQKEKLLEEISHYCYCDPEYLYKIQNNIESVKVAINRWTDNIYAVRSWSTSRMPINEEQFNKYFNIPEDLDYIET